MKFLKINEFIIKIFAFLFMTLDHIGIFLINYSTNVFEDPMYSCGFIFRCFGRLAFPLFILMLVEGVRHSKNCWKYLLRISIVMSIVLISQIIIYYFISQDIEYAYSPLIDLFLCALTLILLKRKDKYSLLSILPIAYLAFTFIVQLCESFNNIKINYFPFYIRPGYSILGLILSLLFFYSYEIVDKIAIKKGVDLIAFKELPHYQFLINVTQILFLVLINIAIYALTYLNLGEQTLWFNNEIQTWSMFASILIFFYNGKRGYNKKWFQYASYCYFPVHIIIIYFVFFLLYR